jgi:ABC-2 type transport system ATP-binding protein
MRRSVPRWRTGTGIRFIFDADKGRTMPIGVALLLYAECKIYRELLQKHAINGMMQNVKGGISMIDFEHVVKQYGKSDVRAVDDLTLHVGKGQVFGFIGPNGAGKTTSIRLLTGILQPTSGSVKIGGVSMKDDPIGAKRLIGFVPDGHELYDRLTGLEYLNFMADVYGVSEQQRKAHIEKYLALFELENAAGEQIKSYSRGMKQKLTIIGALIHQPPLWVLDEPMVGLDPRAAHILKEEMRAHCEKGNTVFFSTHVLEVAEKLCDEIAIIDKGHLIAQGTLEELRSAEKGASLEQLFLE